PHSSLHNSTPPHHLHPLPLHDALPIWTSLHSGPNATAPKCWHVHFAQASARTHLAIGEPKPHRGPAHFGLARCGSTTADVNAWSTPHTTSSLDELDHRNLLSA